MDNTTLVRVTLTRDYLIPDYAVAQYGTMENLLEQWLKYMGHYHASRDAFAIGASEAFLSSEIIQRVYTP